MDYKIGSIVRYVQKVDGLNIGQCYKIRQIRKENDGISYVYVFEKGAADGYRPERFKLVDLEVFENLGD